MNALVSSLTENELSLVRETERARLAELDEDELVELHTRVRRARDKHTKVYRRRAAVRIEEVGGRGKAYAQNTRNRAKAEVFENALARVSDRLAAAARASARALRAERLAEARDARNAAPPASPAAESTDGRAAQRLDNRPDHLGLPKRHASTRAVGARRQARRDSR